LLILMLIYAPAYLVVGFFICGIVLLLNELRHRKPPIKPTFAVA